MRTEEVHHKTPLSMGGSHDRENLIALCKSCHARIHAQSGDHWGIKKLRLNCDILRCSRNSVKKGLDNSFITTSTAKEIVVVISAAIGNTSFRNSGICPMNYRYPSVGFLLFIPHS